MISIAVFAFAICHPGHAFQDAFDKLYTSIGSVQKGEEVDMNAHAAETPFLGYRHDQQEERL